VVFLDDAVKAAKLATINTWIIDRSNELPIFLTVMDDRHNRRVVPHHAATYKHAFVWVLGEGPLGIRKLLVVNIVHHSGREQITFKKQWLGSEERGVFLPGVVPSLAGHRH
jgi:hypothetical protein